jgi:hypothetical protein
VSRGARRGAGVLGAVTIAALAVMGLTAGGAGADVGVGITARTITLTEPVPAGGTAKSTGVYVVNTGSETGGIHLRVADLEHTKHHAVPASWVTFTPSTVTLGSKKGTVIPFTVSVPHDAALGAYQTDLVATGTPAGAKGGTGTQVGAAAATRFTFTVVAPRSSGGLHIPTWVWIALGAIVVVALLVWLVRASGLRLHVERTSPKE